MPRALFEKTGNAVWISHLDLMRLFQRAFKRAGLPLTHTQGYNPRPSVSIAFCRKTDIQTDDYSAALKTIKVFLHKPFTAVVNNAAFDKKWSASAGNWND